MPFSVTLCGLPVALSAIESVPLLAAVPVGVKVIVIVQLAFTAKGVPSTTQVPPETANGPVVEISENVTVCAPVLVFFTVTVIGALVVFCACAGNVTVVGVAVTVGPDDVVVPLSGTLCGFPVALSFKQRRPCWAPFPSA